MLNFSDTFLMCDSYNCFMKQWVLLLLLLLLAACAPRPEAPQEKPAEQQKVVEKVVVQCWDGSTADSVEQCPSKPEEKVEEKMEEPAPAPMQETVAEPAQPSSIVQKLLDEARSKFTGYAYLLDDRMVIVIGNKVRHLYLKQLGMTKDRIPITDVYVDLDKQTAVAYCNVEREGRMFDSSFDWERSKCKDYLDKEIPVAFSEWAPKGPIEYLEEFAHLEPILVEDNVQTVSIGGTSKTVQPSLHYMVDGKRVVLRIDRRYHVPIKVEVQGQQAIDFREAFFDVMVLYGKQEKISPDWVEYQPVSEYWKAAASK